MSGIEEQGKAQVAAFDAGWGALIGSGRIALDGPLGAWRADAISKLAGLSMPGRKDEAWRFIRLRGLEQGAWTPGADRAVEVDASALAGRTFAETEARRVVFVDGRFSQALSTLEAQDGVSVRALSTMSEQELRGLALGELTSAFADDRFAGLNAAAFEDGLAIEVRRDTVAAPVHALFVSTGGHVSTHPRLHVRVGMGAKLSLVEEHITLASEDDAAFTNACAEIALAPSASVHHVKVQRESEASFHVARLGAMITEGASYEAVTINLGAQLSRHDQHAAIVGGNASCALHGLTFVTGAQVSDTHSTMDHRHPHATSDQVHKCVIGGKAHAVFNGKICVRQVAQQTAAFQLNRNLLLSDRARIDTKPQLEIFADDVKCSHGATIGQLDQDQLFYLRSRGIDAEQARSLLTYAFAAEVLEHVKLPSVQKTLAAALTTRFAS